MTEREQLKLTKSKKWHIHQNCYACGSQEHQIRSCNTKRNIFVTCNKDDTMDVKELQSIMAEYRKVKSIKVIHYRNGGIERRAKMCYETEQ